MAPRPFQLHARKEIVTVETIARPVTSFADRELAEAEADLWRRAGFVAEVVDTSAGEKPSFDGPMPEAPDPADEAAAFAALDAIADAEGELGLDGE